MILENEDLRLEISQLGAELKSVFHKKLQKEILYDGKSSFWNRSSPVLFPIVGKLKDNRFLFDDKTYPLSQHGFARDCEFETEEKTDTSACYVLKSDTKIRSIYPFYFELRIRYKLLSHTVTISYEVKNSGDNPLLFSIGAHPGFNCPLFESESIEDYFICFEKDVKAEKHLLDASTGLFSGKTEEVYFSEGKLNLSKQLFERDALVFKKLNSRQVSLENRAQNYKLRFSFPDFPYFAVWSKPGAPFVCLEPWCGLADSVDTSGNLSQKEGIITLAAKTKFERNFSFEVCSFPNI